MIRITRCVAVLVLACCAPSAALAQQLPEWSMDIKLGKPLYVTLLTGERVEGIAGSVTQEGISVATAVGVRTAKFADIRRVQRRDGPWNGIWIGTAVGTALGVAEMVSNDGCEAYAGFSSTCGQDDGYLAIAGAIYGGLIGWGVDTLMKGRSTLFDNNGATKISVDVGRRGVSGRLSFGW